MPFVPTQRRAGLSRPFVVVCVAFGLLVVAWATLWFAALTVHQTRNAVKAYGGVDELRIDGGAGDIDVIAEDRSDVRVVARSEWSLSEPDQIQRFAGGTLQLSGECGFWGSFGPDGCSTDFEIYVPRAMPVTASVSSGDVQVIGLEGPVTLDVSSGDVKADDLSGTLRIGTSSGDVDVGGYRGRDVSVHGSSGDMEVRTRSVPDSIRAVTSSGDVTVAVPGGVAYDVETGTSSGDQAVDVDQSADAANAIEAVTSSGDVNVVRLGDAR